MRALERARSHLLPAALTGAIAALFASQLRALARHRVDYPIMDDWRYYTEQFGMPRELSLHWLAKPAHDTIHVSGKLLDWLYFHLVAHDYARLATTSFACGVGVWLACAVALCFVAARHRPLLESASLAAFALPLATVPYWITSSPLQWLEPVIAYHQMLPIAGLFAVGLLAAIDTSRVPRALLSGGTFCATLFFALAYSSGAVALTVFGGALTALTWYAARGRGGVDRRLALGGAVLAAGLIALALHVLLPAREYGVNPLTAARRGLAFTPPWETRFWYFLFALFDRAVLSTGADFVTFVRGFCVLLGVVAPVALLLARIASGRLAESEQAPAIAVLAIVLAVLSYAAMVTYGRASFGDTFFPFRAPPTEQAVLYAHSRFYYWWVSATLPLVVVAWGLALEHGHSRRAAGWIAAGLVALSLLPKSQHPDTPGGYLDHWRFATRCERDAAELRDLIEVDRAWLTGRRRWRQRRLAWMQLPPQARNRSYNVTYPRTRGVFTRAEAAGATFVRRWGLPVESGSP